MPPKIRHNWATYLNDNEHEKMLNLVEFFFQNRLVDSKSRYRFVKFLLNMCYDVLYEDRVVELAHILKKLELIDEKSLVEAFNYAILYTHRQMMKVYRKKFIKPVIKEEEESATT